MIYGVYEGFLGLARLLRNRGYDADNTGSWEEYVDL